MPACSTAKNPRGVSITFTESDHRYCSELDGKIITYNSVTTLISKYVPQFDPTGEITERCAKKEGISVEEIKERWAAKGRESCRIGTRMHEVIEDTVLCRQLRNIPENYIEEHRFNNAIKTGKTFRQKFDILGVEKLVFDERLKIAGTIDLLAQSKTNKKIFYIIDHKSNEKIEQDNPYNKFCLEPLISVPDNSFYHYALQLNLYQYLLKYGNYIPKDSTVKMIINHITPKKINFLELPDMQSEIKDLLIDYLLKSELKVDNH